MAAHRNTPGEPAPEIRALMGVFALYWQIDKHLDAAEAAPQLSRAEAHLVLLLERPRRMGALARMMATVPSAVTAAAGRLEDLGLARRVRDPQDRRAWRLQLTDTGHARREEVQHWAAALFREVSGLSAAEVREFGRLAAKIHDKIDHTILEGGDRIPRGE